MVTANPSLAQDFFARSCELKFQAGCVNLLQSANLVHEAPRELDLRLMLREGGLNLMEMPSEQLYARACDHGWQFACQRTMALR